MLSLLLGALLASRPYTGPVEVPLATADAVADPTSADITLDLKGVRGPLGAVAWHPGSKDVWLVADDTLVRIAADTGAIVQRLTLNAVDDKPDTLAIAPDGKHIGVITGEATMTVWDVQTGKITIRAKRGDWEPDTYVTFSADSKKVFSMWFGEVRGDEVARVEAWDAASGRSLGTRRAQEIANGSDSPFMVKPIKLAGSHIFFDDIMMLATPWPVRACDGDALPVAVAGEFAYYEDDYVRSMRDCAVKRKAMSIVPAAVIDLSLSADTTRAAYLTPGKRDRALVFVDVPGNAELARLDLSETERWVYFSTAPDGSHVALSVRRNKKEYLLVLWRPEASGGVPARTLTLRVP